MAHLETKHSPQWDMTSQDTLWETACSENAQWPRLCQWSALPERTGAVARLQQSSEWVATRAQHYIFIFN